MEVSESGSLWNTSDKRYLFALVFIFPQDKNEVALTNYLWKARLVNCAEEH